MIRSWQKGALTLMATVLINGILFVLFPYFVRTATVETGPGEEICAIQPVSLLRHLRQPEPTDPEQEPEKPPPESRPKHAPKPLEMPNPPDAPPPEMAMELPPLAVSAPPGLAPGPKIAMPRTPQKNTASGPGFKTAYEASEIDQIPAAVNQFRPAYPYRARRLNLSGEVQVRFLVDRRGQVGPIQIIEATPPDIFDKSVRRALSKWRFSPGKLKGQVVDTWVTTTHLFSPGGSRMSRLDLRCRRLAGFFGKGKIRTVIAFLFLAGSVGNVPVLAKTPPPDALSSKEQRALHLAGQAMEKGLLSEARKQLGPLLTDKDSRPHYLVPFMMGNAWALDKAPAKAVAAYEAALKIQDQDPKVWQNLAKACFDLGRYVRAGEHLLQAHRLTKPGDNDLLFQAASCFLSGDFPRKALSPLESLCSLPEKNIRSEWVDALVRVCLELKNHEKGAALLTRLLDNPGADPKWWRFLAHFHLQAGKEIKAAAAYRMYAESVPAGQKEILFLGDLYRRAGVPLMAAEQYRAACKRIQTPVHWEKLASAYLAGHRPDLAAEVLSRALSRKPTVRLWEMLAGLEYNRENYAAAYDAFEKVLGLDPKNGRAALSMGYCALQAGDEAAAAAAFRRAMGFPGQRKSAASALAAIAATP